MTNSFQDPPARLLTALQRGDRNAALDALREGDDVDARDPRPIVGGQMTALHHAALHGDSFLIRALLKEGADIDARTTTGETPLWFACNGGYLPAVRELLMAGADHTIANREGYAPRDRVYASNAAIIRLFDAFEKQTSQ